VWFVWKNWVGKSSLISMLLGKIQPDDWNIEVWKTVVFGEYQQNEIIFPENKRVVDIVKDIAWYITLENWERLSAEKLLEMFLFPTQQRYQPASRLSWWEKRRLSLVCVLMKNPNFLILDEPTNDLDLITISILEDFLLQYQWCLIIVSLIDLLWIG
jgi:ATP-binding cassette subfamily F protein uup